MLMYIEREFCKLSTTQLKSINRQQVASSKRKKRSQFTMGQTISDAIKASEEKNEEEGREILETLQTLLRNKVDAVSSKLELEAMEDQRLPIVAVVDRFSKFSVNVKSVDSKYVNEMVDNLFSGKFLGGLKKLVTLALEEFLGNVSAGEQEMKTFQLMFSSNSLLRVDYMMYKYQFESHGVKDKYESGFCYFAQIGVLDLEKVNRQVMLYELTKSVGSKDIKEVTEHLMEIAEFAKKLYEVLRRIPRKQNVGVGQFTHKKQGDDDGNELSGSGTSNKDTDQ